MCKTLIRINIWHINAYICPLDLSLQYILKVEFEGLERFNTLTDLANFLLEKSY